MPACTCTVPRRTPAAQSGKRGAESAVQEQDDLTGFALAINDAGAIVGQVALLHEMREHVFIFDGGRGRYIDIQGGIRPVGYDTNELGEVVIDDTEAVAAYVYGHGTLTRLPQPFGEATTRLSAYANNDAGQVVGGAAAADGVQRAYFWSGGRYEWLQGGQGATPTAARDINDLGWGRGLHDPR